MGVEGRKMKTTKYRFKDLRENTYLEDGKQLPLNYLADMLGIDRKKMGRLEKGDFKQIEPETLTAYAKYFNVSVDYLLGISNEKTKNEDIKMICRSTGFSEATVNALIEDNRLKTSNPAEYALFGKRYAPVINDLIKYDEKGNLFNFINSFFHFDERKMDHADLVLTGKKVETQHIDEGLSFLMLADENGNNFPISLHDISGIAIGYISNALTNICNAIDYERRGHRFSEYWNFIKK